MNAKKFRNQNAFTLIEILVVIAILAIIAVVVFVALNPSQRFQDARDSRRVNDVNSILTAVHEYVVDNDGSFPTGLTAGGAETELGSPAAGCTPTCTGVTACTDLTTPLATYLRSLPIDPGTGSTAATGYTVELTSDNILIVRACHAEGGPIEASR